MDNVYGRGKFISLSQHLSDSGASFDTDE